MLRGISNMVIEFVMQYNVLFEEKVWYPIVLRLYLDRVPILSIYKDSITQPKKSFNNHQLNFCILT